MLTLQINRIPAYPRTPEEVPGQSSIINGTGTIPKEFNGLPVVRAPKELGRRGLTNTNIISHPSGVKLSKCPNGYIILCTCPDCGAIGSKEGTKCVKHAEKYRKCRQQGCGKRANFGYEKKKSWSAKLTERIYVLGLC